MVASATIDITLPYKFRPRDYQIPFMRAMDAGCKRAALVWHRRAGKDLSALQWAIKASAVRKGGYYYYFPTAALGRKIIWEGKNNDGFKFLDYFPPNSIIRKNDTEMIIETIWGSHFRIVGTDNLDVVGTNPVGTVWSEFALQDPRAWQLVQPILRANGGWAVFCYTPRGHNHGYDLYEIARDHPKEWFCQKLTIDDTLAISRAEVEADIEAGIITKRLAQQEYWCDFTLGQEGSYYGTMLDLISTRGQIGRVPYDPGLPVHTVWDPGGTTAIWFFQYPRPAVHLIRYHEDRDASMANYATYMERLRETEGYRYGQHFAPFDVTTQNGVKIIAGQSIVDAARDAGVHFVVLQRERRVVEEGIPRTLRIMPNCYFDETNCKQGLWCLKQYREQVNKSLSTEDNPVFTGRPADGPEDHGADAFRYVSMALTRLRPEHMHQSSREEGARLRALYGRPM